MRRIASIVAPFFVTVLLMALQKPLFMLFNLSVGGDTTVADWLAVLWNGLKLDMTTAGYVSVLPLIVVLLSVWIKLPEKWTRRVMLGYFIAVSVVTSAIFTIDVGLYEHWGFRIDSSVLVYLSNPEGVTQSVDLATIIVQSLLFVLYATLMIMAYRYVVRFFPPKRLQWQWAFLATPLIVLAMGLDFLAIRGGTEASVANISKVYFSPRQYLNHAAINPVFSLLSTLGKSHNYAEQYQLLDEAERAEIFECVRGGVECQDSTLIVLNRERPNVAIVLLESFSRVIMDERVDGEAVAPELQEIKQEGVWFENFFASSFRTDRGEVAILSGFPAQTHISIMKLPSKSRNLPSIARSLQREGYATSFTYGGDLNFTNQASYMYATGWEELIWQQNLSLDVEPADWGYDDMVMCEHFAQNIIEQSQTNTPFLAGLLTLSSHAPFDVPLSKFENKVLNSMAFTDMAIGQMVATLKESEAWDNLLLVFVADHGYPYPKTLEYNSPLRHRIPMIWTGGAVAKAQKIDTYGAQIDICATILAQMGVSYADYDYSKNMLCPSTPHFAYYTFNDGFGVVDEDGAVVWDAATQTSITNTNPSLLPIGKAILQTTYQDIDKR